MVEYILILLIKFFVPTTHYKLPTMTTLCIIKMYQEEYAEVEEHIAMVQKKIDILESDMAKLRSSIEDDTDFYMLIGLNHELSQHLRLMDCLLDHKAQAAKKLANLRKGKGDF